MLLLAAAASRAEESRSKTLEYPVKAAFLYQFARFTEWPVKAGDSSPLCIGVLGDDPFGAALHKSMSGKSVGGRPLSIRRSPFVVDLDGCAILFVARSESGDRLQSILQQAARWPALTVGESEGFTQSGGMVRFFLNENHVRFEVNIGAVEAAGLRLSSRLLALAQITGTQRGGR